MTPTEQLQGYVRRRLYRRDLYRAVFAMAIGALLGTMFAVVLR